MSEAGLEGYLEEAASWERDLAARAARSERRAWWVAGMGWLLAVLAAVALAALAPLKSVQPFVVRVDNTTGVVDVVPALSATNAIDETVTRYLLMQYVTVCERFNLATAEVDYEQCGAFHTPALNQTWYAKWAPSNPESPLNRYRDGTVLGVRVKAVSFFTRAAGVRDLAQVRYRVARRLPGSSVEIAKDYIATVQFAYVAPASEARVRQWNPMGFRIVTFETVPEVLPDAGVVDPEAPDPEALDSQARDRQTSPAAPAALTRRDAGVRR